MRSALTSIAFFENILNFFGASLKAISYFRTKGFHRARSNLAKDLQIRMRNQDVNFHEQEINLAKKMHAREKQVMSKHHSIAINKMLEQHFHQLSSDLISAAREAERDMYDQRSAEFQTLMFCATAMFTALSMILVQGQLPLQSRKWLYTWDAIICGLSFSLLFVCILVSAKIVLRSSKFMYRRATRQARRVYHLIHQTKDFLHRIRYED